MVTPPPVAALSRHSSTVRIRLSASARTIVEERPAPPGVGVVIGGICFGVRRFPYVAGGSATGLSATGA
jgi:hypothetical protein